VATKTSVLASVTFDIAFVDKHAIGSPYFSAKKHGTIFATQKFRHFFATHESNIFGGSILKSSGL
jgi:hypothetical protein